MSIPRVEMWTECAGVGPSATLDKKCFKMHFHQNFFSVPFYLSLTLSYLYCLFCSRKQIQEAVHSGNWTHIVQGIYIYNE